MESHRLGFTRIEVAQGRRDAWRNSPGFRRGETRRGETHGETRRVEKRTREAHRSWPARRGAERRGGARGGAGPGEGAWSVDVGVEEARERSRGLVIN